jgi:aspartate aminotransferase
MSDQILSTRVKNLQESATLKINAIVNRLKADGKVIYNLTAGEPDFAPPAEAKKAVVDAVEKNLSKYTPTPGILELRELVAKRTNEQQQSMSSTRPWKATDVVVTNGGKQAIFDTVMALIDRGDEAICIAPFWLSYPEMIKAAEGSSVIIQTRLEDDYKVTPEQLEKAITSKTKLVFLNSPSNPTGSLYNKAELQALGKVFEKHPRVFILSDEIYDRIDFTASWCSFLEANPQLRDRTITVNGLSKSGAMTGWRIGWSLTPEVITKALVALQGHSTSGICSLSQAAAVAALKLPKGDFEPQRLQYLNRRNLALEVLKKSAKIKVYEPAGAFYLFLDLKALMKGTENADGFAEKLLQDIQVAVVSGVDFGAPTCVRISFATDEQTIQTACERLVAYCNSL